MRNVKLSTDHGFSMFQHATHTKVLLGLGRVKPTGFAVCARTFARINLYAQDHTASSFCRSLLQACYIVALDTVWPWANNTYGLCCLRAYFCAHDLIRARSYVVIPQIGLAMGLLLQIRMSWLRALSKRCRCWCWCWCQLIVRAVEVPYSGCAGCVHSCSQHFIG